MLELKNLEDLLKTANPTKEDIKNCKEEFLKEIDNHLNNPNSPYSKESLNELRDEIKDS